MAYTVDDYRARLRRGYEYVIVPTNTLDTPIVDKDFIKSDVPLTYWTLNELSQALGSDFVLVQYFDPYYRLFHWTFNKGYLLGQENAEQRLIAAFKGMGLTDMRDDKELVSEIDFENLEGTELGVFGSDEIFEVPKSVTTKAGG